MGMTLIDLLSADGEKAKEISGSFDAPMTIDGYLNPIEVFALPILIGIIEMGALIWMNYEHCNSIN
ncbi:MAG: hypothetical protein Ct9H300mP19_06280 [Dehalococcoidia bacterium]|nr:MAG: hypothetical protein Ct9H300mP19_06280 [Dehalococcoidia bacterium]